MKYLTCGVLLAAVVAGCSDAGSNGANGGSPGTGGNGTGGNGTGGNGSTTQCGSGIAKKLYTSAPGNVLRGVASDGESVYFMENLQEINAIPKAGGAKTLIATTHNFILDVYLRLFADGSKLYFSDNYNLYSVDKSGGTPISLVKSKSSYARGIDPTLAFEGDYIYFGDKVGEKAGEALGTVNRVSKTSGAVEVLASNQAGPGSIAFDDTHLYWVNEGTINNMLESLDNGGLASLARTGGSPRMLFSQTSEDDISPLMGEVLVGENDLYFGSLNLENFASSGEYKIPKTGGTPTDFSSCITMGAFIRAGKMYANCGDSISSFDLATGSETEIVCMPTAFEGALLMTHDDTTMYYIKAEPEDAAGPGLNT